MPIGGGVRGVMGPVTRNELGDTSSNPWGDCIFHSANILEKGKNPNVLLHPSYGVNSRAHEALQFWYGNRSWRRKTLLNSA